LLEDDDDDEMPGLSVVQILSDETHYRPLVCVLCQNLVSLDSVVTSRCSHAFCTDCLEENVVQQSSGGSTSIECPACHTALHEDPSLECMEFSHCGVTVAARPLPEAQPLAFQLLQLVQVACMVTDKSTRCEWSGNYEEFMSHVQCHHSTAEGDGTHNLTPVMTSTNGTTITTTTAAKSNNDNYNNSGTSLIGISPEREGEMSPNPISMDNLKNPKSPRWISNGSIAQAPAMNGKDIAHATAPPSSSAPALGRDMPPNLVKRTKSLNPNPSISSNNDGGGGGVVPERNTGKPIPEDKILKKRASSRKFSLNDSINDLDNSMANHMNGSDNLRNQSSINSLQGWDNSFSDDMKPMETLTEDHGESASVILDDETIQQTLEQAEKLKKQANAKFNKGDFNAARTLYTNGINLMASIPRRPDGADGELLSNMHSNRAVTYFREKQFDRCIDDCNMAIQYDGSYEKSWIRKWRALMALGVFEEALHCLEHGAETVSNPTKIRKELTKAREEMEMLQKARRLLEESEFASVRDMLKSYTRNSDNIGLLHMAALADCGLGSAEAAIEKANKALRFNPYQADGLAIRGYALFLSGDTEKGTSLIQDAHSRDKENKRIKKDFQRCSKTHSMLTKGRSCVKRGRYMEAVEHFTGALKDCGTISENTVLYGMLRSERAEAWMLTDKFLEALKDCQEVINAQRENAAAWTVRAEVLIALGKAEEAKKELMVIRKSWGADNQTIEEGYRRVDFELRVMKADRDLMRFIKELDRGLVPDGGVVPEDDGRQTASARRSEQRGGRPPSRDGGLNDDRRAMMERAASRRTLLSSSGKASSSRRLLQETEKPKSSRNLMLDPKDRPQSSKSLLTPANRAQSSRNLMSSGHRQQSSRKLDAHGDKPTRPSSSKRLGGERDEERRNAMRKAKSSRRVADGENGPSHNSSRQKAMQNGLERKSMSERTFDSSKPRPSSVKRT